MISGYLAMLTTLMLWAGFFLSLRAGAHSDLTLADIALTRFLLPSVLLLPLIIRARRQILAVPKRYLFGLFIGSGLPYFVVAGNGMQLAPVSDGSTLIPGTLPLFVSTFAVIFFAQPLSSHRLFGLISIVCGTAIFIMHSYTNQSSLLYGHLLFLLGSAMWASFTICARVANLKPLVTAGLVSCLSSVSLLALIASGTLDSHLLSTDLSMWKVKELAIHLLLQGFGAGLIAAITYLHAISTLGAERTAAFGAATPAVATLMAIPALGELPSTTTMIAMGLVTAGSIIASNIFMKRDTSLAYQPPSYR